MISQINQSALPVRISHLSSCVCAGLTSVTSCYKHQPRALFVWSKVIPIFVRLALAQLYWEPLIVPFHADKRARKAHSSEHNHVRHIFLESWHLHPSTSLMSVPLLIPHVESSWPDWFGSCRRPDLLAVWCFSSSIDDVSRGYGMREPHSSPTVPSSLVRWTQIMCCMHADSSAVLTCLLTVIFCLSRILVHNLIIRSVRVACHWMTRTCSQYWRTMSDSLYTVPIRRVFRFHSRLDIVPYP